MLALPTVDSGGKPLLVGAGRPQEPHVQGVQQRPRSRSGVGTQSLYFPPRDCWPRLAKP